MPEEMPGFLLASPRQPDRNSFYTPLHFMVESKLQVLLATPPDKAGGLLPHVDCVRTVVRKNNHAFVIEINKTEVMQELEGAEYSRSVPHG